MYIAHLSKRLALSVDQQVKEDRVEQLKIEKLIHYFNEVLLFGAEWAEHNQEREVAKTGKLKKHHLELAVAFQHCQA